MKQKTINQLQLEVNKSFIDAFSRTPLRQRIQDIHNEATELFRYVDFQNLKEETGDLLASTLQLCNENGWNADDLVQDTLNKIARRNLQYKSLGRKTNVCVIGGAYDSVTLGHIKLAQFILNTSSVFDEAWLAPCSTHLYGKKMMSPEHRLAMCEIAAKVDGRIKIFDYEIAHKLSGETYHFAKKLLEESYSKDKYDFSFAIGLDNANTFDKWVNYQDLERMIRFVVVSRQGVERNPKVNWYLKSPHIFLMAENGEIPEVSSTLVRQLLNGFYFEDGHCKRDSVKDSLKNNILKYVDKNVFEYIVKNKLYKEKK